MHMRKICVSRRAKDLFIKKLLCMKTKKLKKLFSGGQQPSHADQIAMLERSDSEKAMKAYVKHYGLCKEAQLRMLEMPNALQLLDIYSQRFWLSKDAEIKMLEHRKSADLLKAYVPKRRLSYEAQVRMLDVPNSLKLREIYGARRNFCEQFYVALYERQHKES